MSTGKTTPLQKYDERTGLLISVLIHIGLFFFILSRKPPVLPDVTTIDVTIEPMSTSSPKKQLVSPSLPSVQPPEDTSRLSEVNSRTEIEKIKRGDGGGIPGQKTDIQPAPPNPKTERPRELRQNDPSPKEPAKETQSKQEKLAPTHHKRDLNLSDLKLDDATLALKFGSTPKVPSQQRASSQQSQNLEEYQAFSRPPGSGAAFLGTAGISDHLPNLPDGDITLLNAKANQYAGFVRRVAVQVFTQLRTQGWEKLSASELRRLSDFTTIEAVMSADGTFLGAQVHGSSGSTSFDGVVHQSATRGTSDPNPPQGAQAKDGKIHFIFRARSWSQMGVNPRSGAPSEHRWLLLATGLE